MIDAAQNEIHIWGLTVSANSPVIRVADVHHPNQLSAEGKYFNFNADDLWIREDHIQHGEIGQEMFSARVQQCQFDEAGDPLETFEDFRSTEPTMLSSTSGPPTANSFGMKMITSSVEGTCSLWTLR